MSKTMTYQEIEQSLAPCPFCGSKVKMLFVNQGLSGVIARFVCPCGVTADFEYVPEQTYITENIRDRRRLLPWDQWNRRDYEKWPKDRK